MPVRNVEKHAEVDEDSEELTAMRACMVIFKTLKFVYAGLQEYHKAENLASARQDSILATPSDLAVSRERQGRTRGRKKKMEKLKMIYECVNVC